MMKLAALPLFLTAFTLTSAPIHAEEAAVAQPAPMPPKQTLLEQPVDLDTTKIQASVFRLTLPRGFKTPQHVHDGPGPRYVVKGRVKIEEPGQTAEYGPGQVFWETGGVMTAENISEGEAELIIFEVSHRKPAPTPPEAATPKK
jgi:quercetin dioxygenase-like cupin family protein